MGKVLQMLRNQSVTLAESCKSAQSHPSIKRSVTHIIKGSLEVLTSDYTESCRLVLQHRCET